MMDEAARDEDGTTWESVPLYGPDVSVWRASDGSRFRVAVRGAPPVTFAAADKDALEAALIALMDVKRALTNEDFVPAKTQGVAGVKDAAAGVPVRFDPEDLEYLRMRVRVGKEDSLDDAVGRAVKAYMRQILHREFGEDEAPTPPARPRPARSQRTLGNAPQGLSGIGTTQLQLLQITAKKGFVTRFDVGRLYGITARRGGASSARRKTEGYLNALIARGLLRAEQRNTDTVWVLTELGRTAVEQAQSG